MPPLEFKSPSDLPPTANYSHTVAVPSGHRLIYVSGQVPLDETGSLVGSGDFEAQAFQVFRNLERALHANSAGLGDLVKLGLYVKNMDDLLLLRRVRDQFITGEQAPASTLVQVSGFFRPDILFELDAIAAVPDRSS